MRESDARSNLKKRRRALFLSPWIAISAAPLYQEGTAARPVKRRLFSSLVVGGGCWAWLGSRPDSLPEVFGTDRTYWRGIGVRVTVGQPSSDGLARYPG